VLRHADMVVTSLTKSFSGVGDVMAGSVVLNPDSAFYPALRRELAETYEDLFWEEDAAALERNSRDFSGRMAQINANTEALCDFLAAHPAVARVYYPKYETPENYAQVLRPGGGYSCLFSLLLKDAATAAPRFYDRLRVCKGPSLGLNFTICCPYILLAHYDELDWAESAGLDRNLVRVSVGLEDIEDLVQRFGEALEP
jgi:cystathionine gamma-synthase